MKRLAARLFVMACSAGFAVMAQAAPPAAGGQQGATRHDPGLDSPSQRPAPPPAQEQRRENNARRLLHPPSHPNSPHGARTLTPLERLRAHQRAQHRAEERRLQHSGNHQNRQHRR